MTAQLLNITPDEYFKHPGFNSSTATTLLTVSPLHAREEHPAHRRGETREEDPTKEMDRGSIIGRLLLGKGADFEVVAADSYRTDRAKAARDAARDAGKIPVLEHKLAEYLTVATKIAEQLQARGLALTGQSEAVIEWTEVTVLCKAMLDHLWLDQGVILDLKVCSSIATDDVERSAERFGYAVQRAAYTRAVEALRPDLAGRVRFLFAFAEAEPPYAVTVREPDGVFRELGEKRWLRAVRTWGQCLATNTWPGPPDAPLSAPLWALRQEGLDAP